MIKKVNNSLNKSAKLTTKLVFLKTISLDVNQNKIYKQLATIEVNSKFLAFFSETMVLTLGKLSLPLWRFNNGWTFGLEKL